MTHLTRLGDRLDVIERVLDVALQEEDPGLRGRMLGVVTRAAAAARTDQQEAEAAETAEAKRSAFRLVRGAVPPARRPGQPTTAGAVSSGRWLDRNQGHAARSAG